MIGDDLIQNRFSAQLRVEVAHGSAWTDQWKLEGDVAIDLTGMRLQCALRREPSDAEPFRVLDSLMGDFVVSDGPAGVFHASMRGWEIDTLPLGEHFATWRYFSAAEEREFARGAFIVLSAPY